MDELAISLGWGMCTALLAQSAEVCSAPLTARLIGTVGLILAALTVSVPLILWLARPRSIPARPSAGGAIRDLALAPLPDLPPRRPITPARFAVEVDRSAPQKAETARPKIPSVR